LPFFRGSGGHRGGAKLCGKLPLNTTIIIHHYQVTLVFDASSINSCYPNLSKYLADLITFFVFLHFVFVVASKEKDKIYMSTSKQSFKPTLLNFPPHILYPDIIVFRNPPKTLSQFNTHTPRTITTLLLLSFALLLIVVK